MAGDDQTSEIAAVRGRLIERVHQQVREIEEAAGMSDMRATERLLEFIGEQTGDPKILEAVAELRRRGDTLVRMNDLRLVAAAANHGKLHGPLASTDFAAFDAALTRIEDALGGVL